jgi:hypothetical protein
VSSRVINLKNGVISGTPYVLVFTAMTSLPLNNIVEVNTSVNLGGLAA